MTVKGVNQLSPFTASATFLGSGQPLLTGPNNIVLTEKEFHHDVCTMDFWGDNVDSDSYYSGMPMILSFGRPGMMRLFTGYVNHASRRNSRFTDDSLMDRNSTNITCLGASFWLKEPGTDSWANRTVSQVVQEIADRFGLSAQVEDHPTVWGTLQMAGKSYWEFMCGLAKKVGYTFYCNGVQLVFRSRPVNPIALTSAPYIIDYLYDPWKMMSFTPILGSNSPANGQLRNRYSATVDPRTNNLINNTVSGSPALTFLGQFANLPLFDDFEHITCRSAEELSVILSGLGLNNQMYLYATAVCAGNSAITKGSVIQIQNANGAQNGLWYVHEVRHLLNQSTYEMHLVLGRDSIGPTTGIVTMPTVATLPTPLLQASGWRAA